MVKQAFQIGGPLGNPPFYALVSPGVATVHDLAIEGSDLVNPLTPVGNGTLVGWGHNMYAGRALNTTSTNIVGTSTTFPNGTYSLWGDPQNSTPVVFAMAANGVLSACGSATNGKIGDGTTTARPTTWVPVSNALSYSCVAVGSTSTIAIERSTGDMYGWGAAIGGFWTGSQLVPLKCGSQTWKKVVTCPVQGSFLAIDNADHLWSWGINTNYLTAQGTNTGATATPTQVGSDTWLDIAVGSNGAMGVKLSDGFLYTWGTQGAAFPVLGNGGTTNVSSTTPTKVTAGVGSSQFTQVSTYGALGSSCFCLALDTTGAIWQWGSGTLGFRNSAALTTATGTPEKKVDGTYKKIVAGASFWFGLNTANTLVGWGFLSATAGNGAGALNLSPNTLTTQLARPIADNVEDFYVLNDGATVLRMK